jgi:hypothetical protein
MTTITLELPDDVATQLNLDPAALPAFIRDAVASRLRQMQAKPGRRHKLPLAQEVIEFLAAQPTLEQIAAFKISPPAQERLEKLLARQSGDGLTPDETAELDGYLKYRHALIILKASARRALQDRPC